MLPLLKLLIYIGKRSDQLNDFILATIASFFNRQFLIGAKYSFFYLYS